MVALREFINQRTPKGRWVSVHPDHHMTLQELTRHDQMIDDEELLGEVDADDSYYEDPESDGYGWERAALREAYANG